MTSRVSGVPVRAKEIDTRRVRFELPDCLPTVTTPTPPQHATRYYRGTLSGPILASAPALLTAAREADDDTIKDILRRASVVGIPEKQLNATDSSGRVSTLESALKPIYSLIPIGFTHVVMPDLTVKVNQDKLLASLVLVVLHFNFEIYLL